MKNLESRRNKLRSKAAARARRRSKREDAAQPALLEILQRDGLTTRAGRSAFRGLVRRGGDAKEILEGVDALKVHA